MKRTIKVKGIGKVSVTPDLIIITFSLETTNKNYEKMVVQSANMLAALRDSISSAGLDGKDLKTTLFVIGTKHERYKIKNDHWESRFEGYVCSHNLKLEFELDMKLLSTVMSAIANCESRPEFKISFTVKDPTAISEQLLEAAVNSATHKAATLAKAANVKLGAIKRIDYSWGELHLYSHTDMKINSRYQVDCFKPDMDIEPDNINVSESVRVVWAIE